MKDILQEIIAQKRITLIEQKANTPLFEIEKILREKKHRIRRSMRTSLEASSSGIIAEFKRKSPSKGWIQKNADIVEVVKAYQFHGASAISILTDTPYFGGSIEDFKKARSAVDIPLLRKEFIIDEYQLYESFQVGADAILLIAAALSINECKHLAKIAHSLNLETLLEIHSEKELDYINEHIDMVGVNNRNLNTFHTDVEVSMRLVSLLPKNMLLVSESGLTFPQTVNQLQYKGYKGFLMGEVFMKHHNPGEQLFQFIQQLNAL